MVCQGLGSVLPVCVRRVTATGKGFTEFGGSCLNRYRLSGPMLSPTSYLAAPPRSNISYLGDSVLIIGWVLDPVNTCSWSHYRLRAASSSVSEGITNSPGLATLNVERINPSTYTGSVVKRTCWVTSC